MKVFLRIFFRFGWRKKTGPNTPFSKHTKPACSLHLGPCTHAGTQARDTGVAPGPRQYAGAARGLEVHCLIPHSDKQRTLMGGGRRSEHFPGALSDADADLRRLLRVSRIDEAYVERNQLPCIAPSIHVLPFSNTASIMSQSQCLSLLLSSM